MCEHCANIMENERLDFDAQTTEIELIAELSLDSLIIGNGAQYTWIEIDFCPICGAKVGEQRKPNAKENSYV